MLRVDLIFSYWIYFWFILYKLKITIYNPKFVIICGAIENIIVLISMLYYNTNINLIIRFVIMFIILKVIPLYVIKNTNIKIKDIIATIFLFILYILWTILNGKTSYDFIDNTKNLIIYNKDTLPGMLYLKKFGI